MLLPLSASQMLLLLKVPLLAAGPAASSCHTHATLPATHGAVVADGLVLPEAYARHAQRWVELGASIVGGCCGVGPAHIALLRQQLLAAAPPPQEQQLDTD